MSQKGNTGNTNKPKTPTKKPSPIINKRKQPIIPDARPVPKKE